MKDMFYNYDHDINKKEYPPAPRHHIPKNADSFSGVKILRNALGDTLGVVAKQNSIFDLYFYLDGEVEGGSVADLIADATFRLEIIGKDQKVFYSFPAEIYSLDTLRVQVIASDEDSFGYGVYKLKLIMTLDGDDFTMLSENNAILSID